MLIAKPKVFMAIFLLLFNKKCIGVKWWVTYWGCSHFVENYSFMIQDAVGFHLNNAKTTPYSLWFINKFWHDTTVHLFKNIVFNEQDGLFLNWFNKAYLQWTCTNQGHSFLHKPTYKTLHLNLFMNRMHKKRN